LNNPYIAIPSQESHPNDRSAAAPPASSRGAPRGGPDPGAGGPRQRGYGNSADGLQFRSASGGRAEFNTGHDNGISGLKYMGNGGVIHDNTAYGNGEFGIYVRDGVDHQVWDNTAYGNAKGNIKIPGSTLPPPWHKAYVQSLRIAQTSPSTDSFQLMTLGRWHATPRAKGQRWPWKVV
jgi:parallel beta-helix repeat protein